MRIIAGEFRGRNLLAPKGSVTRPITDRVKQSLFDILSPRIEQAVVWDLFSGTGSMGLESLSRGAAKAAFFEADRSAVQRLRKNIAAIRLPAPRVSVHHADIFKFFGAGTERALDKGLTAADLIFLDPPYRFLKEQTAELQRLTRRLAQVHLKPGGLIIFRHDAGDAIELPEVQRYDQRTYGGMMLDFLTGAVTE